MNVSQKIQAYVLTIIEGKRKNSLVKALLLFLSFFFRFAVFFRHFLYDRGILKAKGIKVPVISVGNIVAGGTGKTPFIEFLVRHLPYSRIAVLSRGYRSTIEKKGMNIDLSDINRQKLNSQFCGDETMLLARHLPQVSFFVGKNRIKCAQAAVKKGSEVILLDDGFQYLKLKKKKEILLLNAKDPFGKSYFLPRGFLRDHPKQLKKADLIVINGVDDADQFKEIKEKVKKFTSTPCIGTKVVVKQGSAFKGARAGIFCGIGNPERFKDTLVGLDVSIVDELYTLDHLAFSLKEITDFASRCKKKGAEILLCTEKDFIKLPFPFSSPLPIRFIEISLYVVGGEKNWQDFLTSLKHRTPL